MADIEAKPADMPEAREARKKPPMGRVLAAALIIFVAGGFIWWHQATAYISTDNARVSADIVDIGARVSGRVDGIAVKEGDTVAAGQELVTIDSQPYKIALMQAEANLEMAKANEAQLPMNLTSADAAVNRAKDGLSAARAQCDQARVSAQDALRLYEKSQQLYEAGAISAENLTQAKSRYDMAMSTLKAQEAAVQSAQAVLDDALAKAGAVRTSSATVLSAQVKQAQAAYDSARLNLDNTVIKAPCAGTVLRLPVSAGENITAGQTVVTIADLSNTWVSANIEEKKIGRVKAGQQVDVKIDAYPGKTFPGLVTSVGEAAQSTFALIPSENTSGNFTKVAQRLQVKIEVETGGLTLKPGMSAVVKIHTSR